MWLRKYARIKIYILGSANKSRERTTPASLALLLPFTPSFFIRIYMMYFHFRTYDHVQIYVFCFTVYSFLGISRLLYFKPTDVPNETDGTPALCPSLPYCLSSGRSDHAVFLARIRGWLFDSKVFGFEFSHHRATFPLASPRSPRPPSWKWFKLLLH